MAQLAEHILGKDEVPGSNPGISSRYKAPLHLFAMGCFYVQRILIQSRTRRHSFVFSLSEKENHGDSRFFYRRDLISVL